MIIAGKDKGKKGKVVKTLSGKNQVVVEGINLVTKHQKKNRATRTSGQIIEKTMPINASNVALLDGDKPIRVGYTFADKESEADDKGKKGEKQKKVRIARPTGNKI